jgi:hypothetical protein
MAICIVVIVFIARGSASADFLNQIVSTFPHLTHPRFKAVKVTKFASIPIPIENKTATVEMDTAKGNAYQASGGSGNL